MQYVHILNLETDQLTPTKPNGAEHPHHDSFIVCMGGQTFNLSRCQIYRDGFAFGRQPHTTGRVGF